MLLLMTMLFVSSSFSAIAKTRKTPRQYNDPVVVPLPEDPQAHAMARARMTWPGRPLCDDGGYRIRPCDMLSPRD
jgi:hypothetical protein